MRRHCKCSNTQGTLVVTHHSVILKALKTDSGQVAFQNTQTTFITVICFAVIVVVVNIKLFALLARWLALGAAEFCVSVSFVNPTFFLTNLLFEGKGVSRALSRVDVVKAALQIIHSTFSCRSLRTFGRAWKSNKQKTREGYKTSLQQESEAQHAPLSLIKILTSFPCVTAAFLQCLLDF